MGLGGIMGFCTYRSPQGTSPRLPQATAHASSCAVNEAKSQAGVKSEWSVATFAVAVSVCGEGAP